MDINGLLVIDKPADISSANVVARVKRIVRASKAGHTGTLDPFATGVMLCCVNQGTKLARFFLHGSKTYQAVIHLGIETDTQDSTGVVIARSDTVTVNEENIRSVFQRFKGMIDQKPPVYSALKHEGVPLYKLARRGKPVQKSARQVFISDIKILAIALPEIRFEVSCSAGTYIRALASDIGAALGCGGHLKSLRRIESCGFTIHDAVTLPELEELALSGKISERIIGMADALQEMPSYIADNTMMRKIGYGNIITTEDIPMLISDEPEKFIRIMDKENSLLAILSLHKESRQYNYCSVFYQQP